MITREAAIKVEQICKVLLGLHEAGIVLTTEEKLFIFNNIEMFG